jgi:hypothetical protein
MRIPLRSLLALGFCLALSAALAAKGETTRITVSGGTLTNPVELRDAAIVKTFQVWSGPGTQQCFGGRENCVEGTDGFIVDWSSGEVTARRSGLPHYEVAFYVTDSRVPDRPATERLAYVVDYEYDATTSQGYVYLPAKGDRWWQLNVSSIFRNKEGHWYRATRAWQDAVTPALR